MIVNLQYLIKRLFILAKQQMKALVFICLFCNYLFI